MANLLLIQPKISEVERNHIVVAPLHVLCLAAYIEKDYSVKILDQRLDQNFFSLLKSELEKKPILAGITAMTGGQISFGVKICKFIKKNYPQIPIVWGGVHPSSFPEQTLESPYADFVVIREGEITLLELMKSIENKKNFEGINGLAFKNGKKIVVNPSRKFLDMNSLPMPAWHLVDVERIIKGFGQWEEGRPLNIATTRGCIYRCKFCYNLNFNLKKWRGKKANLVVEEIFHLVEKYKVDNLHFHDDLFACNRKRALSILDLMIQKGLKLRWSITQRANEFNITLLTKLRELGPGRIRVGVESGSEKILNRIHKDITVEQALKSAEIAKDLDIDIVYFFVLGWPDEDEKDRQLTIDLAFKLLDIYPKAVVCSFFIYTPFPDTPLYEEAIAKGFIPPDNLEDWAKYAYNDCEVIPPWVKDSDKLRYIKRLSGFAFSNNPFEALIDQETRKFLGLNMALRQLGLIETLRTLATFIIWKWVRFRFKKSFWGVPFEKYLSRLKKYLTVKKGI